MMDPEFVVKEGEDRSSSLPSPEEAKMNLEMENSSRRFSLGSAGRKNSNTEQTDESLGWNASEHDSSQLPSLEEARDNLPPRRSSSILSNDSSPGTRKKKNIAIVAALILVVAIVGAVAAVVVTQGGGGGAEGEFGSIPMKTDGGDSAIQTDLENLKPFANLRSPTPGPTAHPTVPAGSPSREPTPVPTPGPTTEKPTMNRYDAIQQILINEGVSSYGDLVTSGSPQQKALTWISQTDGLQVPVSETDAIVQRYIMTVVFYSMGGETWRSRLNFLTGKSECSWYRLFRAYNLKKMGVSCNADGKVKEINFPAKFLTGSFPMEMSKLRDLERLDVFNNKDLQGGFPEFLRGLPKLKFIGLHYCDLTGSIPAWVGDMTTLKSLVLSNNGFQGALPNRLGQLTALEDLYLDDNQFQGDISVLKDMVNLKYLQLEDNQFTGSFDNDLVGAWSQLQVLDASHNQFVSSIPVSLFSSPNIQIIDLHENKLVGSIPKFSMAATNLEMLTLNNNFLDGEIPSILGQSTKLRHLDLTGNEIGSTIPASLGNLVNLEICYLANNDFAPAPIPATFANLKKLNQLSLKGTSRTGAIPSWVGDLSSLTMLDLDSNSLSDTIPASIGNLVHLEYLLLNRNKLQGTIPASLNSLSKLSFFVVDKNDLTGGADAVCQLPEAQDMFASADCRGEQPEVTCSCCNICCADGDSACNDDVWLADSNPMWELGYQRAVTVEFDAAPSRSYTIKFTGDIPGQKFETP